VASPTGRFTTNIQRQLTLTSRPPSTGPATAASALTPVLQALLEWGDKWAVTAPPITIQHHDHPLRSRTVCATCGQPVRQRDIRRVSNILGWDITGPAPAGSQITQRTGP
jgi:hypothetical protein